MGTYRYFLSLLVLASHTALRPVSFDFGVSAVVSFFILSGYVMTLLVERYYASAATAPLFYLDRLARIFPQYLFYLAVTVILVGQHRIAFGFVSHCDGYQVALNVAVLPLNWSRMVTVDCWYLPQAWSLALELTFYLIVPFLVASPRLARAMAVMSLAVFIASVAAVLDPQIHGYRTLPGTLFMFIAGMALAQRNLAPRMVLLALWCAMLVLLAIQLFDGGQHELGVTGDVVLGFVVGLPCVAMLRYLRQSQFDDVLGNLSYGVFLNHLLCMNFLEQRMAFPIDSPARLVVLIGAATVLSFTTYRLIERPVLALRRGLRRGVHPVAGDRHARDVEADVRAAA